MQTNRFIFLTVLSTSTLFTSQQETSGIPLKVRAYVPPGNGLISEVVFPVDVGPGSSIADINKQLIDSIEFCAAQEPSCASCGRCAQIRIAKALKEKKKGFVYFFSERLRRIDMTVTVAGLKEMGMCENHSLMAIQSPKLTPPTKDESKAVKSEPTELKRIEKIRSKSAATLAYRSDIN